MLRITQIVHSNSVTLKLEGALREPWVEELRRVCAALEGRAALDLADVQFVDESGLALLCDLVGRPGMSIAACSNFVAELLQLVKP